MNAPSVWWSPSTTAGVLVVYVRNGVVGYVCGTKDRRVGLRTLPESVFLSTYPSEHLQDAKGAATALLAGSVEVSLPARAWLRRLAA